MQKLTKCGLLAFFSLFFFYTHAQDIRVNAGFNLSNFTVKDDDGTYKDDRKMLGGFHVGATAELALSDYFSLQGGLLFTTKGIKQEGSVLNVSYKNTTRLFYLDVPVQFKARYVVSENLNVFGLAGPYIGMGLSGKSKSVQEANGQKIEEEIDLEWGNDENNDNVRRLDLGLGFGVGAELNNSISAAILFDLGLANISAYQDEGTTIRNNVLKFSLAYKL